MFSNRIPLGDLVDFCRLLRHQLGAGLGIVQVLKKQGERGRRSLRPIAARVGEQLQQGSSLSDALEHERGAFPPLFLSMVKLGETTGHLAEIFGELERYYQLELQLRRQFISAAFFPILQFVFAVFIIAAVIFITGILAGAGKPLVTFFGLGGAVGAIAFLCTVAGVFTILGIVYFTISRLGRGQAWMDRMLLRLPVIGPCLFALAMSRFTLALQLTLDSGLSITKGLRLAFDATGNPHFASHADTVVAALKQGQTLHESLEACRLFPGEFLDMVASAETAGSVPEMMRHLAKQYQEETGRRMSMVTRLAGGVVWVCVAGFIIWAIFRLAGVYFGMLAEFAK